MDFKTRFFKRLNKVVQESGLTLKEISKKTGFPTTTLRHYMTDKIPRIRAFLKLCATLHVSADYLLGIGEYQN